MKVFSHRKAMTDVRGLVLKPGMNDVDPKEWAKGRSCRGTKGYLDMGIRGGFTVDAGKDKTPVQSDPDFGTLSDYNAVNAIELVKQNKEKAALEKWAESETRKTVLAAIEERLEELA